MKIIRVAGTSPSGRYDYNLSIDDDAKRELMETQQTAKSSGYQAIPASCGGYHVKQNGRAVRKDGKPLHFGTYRQVEDYIRQQATSTSC